MKFDLAPPVCSQSSGRLLRSIQTRCFTPIESHLYGRLTALGRSAVRPIEMTASHVRRDKAAFSSGCKAHPATAPAGSNRGRHGGDEMSEALG
jgi:hypothetical protein